MTGLLTRLTTTYPLEARVLIVIAVACMVLVLLALLFGLATLWLRYRNVRKERRWARLEARWKPLVLEFLNGEVPPERVWVEVAYKDRLHFVRFLVLVARRLRGEERDVLGTLARPYLREVAGQLDTADAERRARAVQTLSMLGLDEYAATVIGALDDPSPLVAMVAARALSSERHPEFAAHVLKRLHRFTGWDTAFLSSMFASIGPEVAPHLLAVLRDQSREPSVRTVAADALRRLNHLAAGDAAAEVLRTASDTDLLAAALRLLARVGRPEHLPSVRGLIDHPRMPVRAEAATALGAIGSQQDIGLLQLAFDDPSIWVAMHAARALDEIGASSALVATARSRHPRAELAREALAEVEA